MAIPPKAIMIALFVLFGAGADPLAAAQYQQNSSPDEQMRNVCEALPSRSQGECSVAVAEKIDKRQQDLFQSRYLLGLLDQEWSQTYSGGAKPSKDAIKELRKEAKNAEKAVTRLIGDLAGEKPSAKRDVTALSGKVPSDFISTLRRVNTELNTFAHSPFIDVARRRTVIADLQSLRTLLNRF